VAEANYPWKLAWITGASGAICGEIARRLAASGVTVAATAGSSDRLYALVAKSGRIGPFPAGWLGHPCSWRLVFLTNVPLAAVELWWTMRNVPEGHDPHAGKRPDFAGAAAATLGLTGVVFALIQGPAHGWSPRSFAMRSVIVERLPCLRS